MNKAVAILVPVHNGLQYTQQCIRDINASVAGIPEGDACFFTIVIDDGSSDGTGDWLRNNHPEIILLKGDGSLWWSGAVNMGIEYALYSINASYVLLWNNDVSPGTDYFKAVLETANKNHYPITCSMIYNKDKPDTLISTGGYFNRKNGKFGLYNFNRKETSSVLEHLKIDWFGGMGTLIRKDVFESVGLFDAFNFPQYHGDSDFGIRATNAGFQIYLMAGMKIWNDTKHSGIHRSMKLSDFLYSFSSIRSNYNIKKDLLFYKKHSTSYWAYIALVKKYLIYIASFVKWKIFGFFKLGRRY